MKQFRFRMNTDLNFGSGIIKDADQIIKKKGFKNMAFVIDRNVNSHQNIKDFLSRMKKEFTVHVFRNTMAEPDYDFLDEFRKELEKKHCDTNFDCIIGIGGGSTMDLVKGMAVLVTNEGPAINFKGFPEIKNKPIPVVTIPTLPGTGSEIAYNAVFTDSKERNRLGINTELNYPVLSIVDPSLSLSAPKKAVVSGAMDCIGHTLESFISINATHFTRELSKSAFLLWYKAVKKMESDFKDIQARTNLFSASILANMALNNVGSGLGGSFSYPLGAIYGVPHGIGEGMFMPYLTRLYVQRGYLVYDDLHDVIPQADTKLSNEEKNKRFSDYLDKAYDDLGTPKSLKEFGVERNAIPTLIKEIEGAFHEAPVRFDENDLIELFKNFID